VSYLYGDSSEANIDFNYLAFLREVIDAAAVLVETEVAIGAGVDRMRAREADAAQQVVAVEDLGRRLTTLVTPVAKDQPTAPVGRCASSIATSIRDAVEREAAAVKSALASDRADIESDDDRQRARAKEVLEKLLRGHDLPGAESELDISCGTSIDATLRQRTSFGVDAVLALDVPASSVFASDLRVDRIAEGAVELHAHESGGWLKKSDKLVALKLGRYHVTGVTVGEDVVVRLRSSHDANAIAVTVTAHRNGEVTATGSGGDREVMVEDRDKTGLRTLAARLEAAAQQLEEHRAGLVSVSIDNVDIAEHPHPRVLAERLIQAIAPTVKKIARHSRSPGELVLRRHLGDNRREEIFVSTSELMKRLDTLPPDARAVFAPLELGGPMPAPPAMTPTPMPAEDVRHRMVTVPAHPPETPAPESPWEDTDSAPQK